MGLSSALQEQAKSNLYTVSKAWDGTRTRGTPVRVIIAGSRTITDATLIQRAVQESGFNVTEVVEGGAHGVDTLAFDWARHEGIPVKVFVPDWSIGRQAGILRNVAMADYADAVIAIWNGKSRGTEHMINVAYKRRMPCYVLKVEAVDEQPRR